MDPWGVGTVAMGNDVVAYRRVMNRIAFWGPVAIVSGVSLIHCVENPRVRRDAGRTARTETEAPSPAHIGFGDDVPQAHPPRVVRPPTPAVGPVAMTAPATVVSFPEGGGMLAWAGPRPTAPNATNLYVRRYDAVGHGDTTMLMHSVRGTVRAIAGAARTQDALFVWNSSFGAATSQVSAQRLQHDTAQMNSIFNLGLFRITPIAVDGGAVADALGYYALAAAAGTRYVASLRGPLLECDAGLCASARVVEITDDNETIGRGGITDARPGLPVVLAGSNTLPWSLAITTQADTPAAHIATLGAGPFAQLHAPDGQSLVAAWVDAQGGAHAIVVHHDALVWMDAGEAPTLIPVTGAHFVCVNHLAAVAVQRRDGVQTIPVTLPGAQSLVRWATEHAGAHRPMGPDAPFAGIYASGWIGAGWLTVSPAGVGFSTCQGDVLMPPTLQPDTDVPVDASALH